MFPDYPSSRRHKQVPLLVIEDNQDHKLLIAYSLRTKVPQCQPVFAHTTEEALIHLVLTYTDSQTFPQLVLLDLYIPDIAQGWLTLIELRKQYRLLPIIILSSCQDDEVVKKAYELGANSFISKPIRLDEWESTFQLLNEYWFSMTTLPPLPNNYSVPIA